MLSLGTFALPDLKYIWWGPTYLMSAPETRKNQQAASDTDFRTPSQKRRRMPRTVTLAVTGHRHFAVLQWIWKRYNLPAGYCQGKIFLDFCHQFKGKDLVVTTI
jgi:hypothetical protein